MAIQYSVPVRNGKLEAVETVIGASPTMKIFTGAKPANTATADAGTVLATLALPADWMAAAANGVKAMAGTWQDNSADASGDAGYFRIYASDGTCHIQGTVGATGSGADMIVDSVTFAAGQTFSVTSFSIADNNG